MPPIIASIATMTIYRVYDVSDKRRCVGKCAPDDRRFHRDCQRIVLGIPNLVVTVIVVALLAYYFLGHTPRAERYMQLETIRELHACRINVERINYLVYALSGVLCGFSGVLWVSRYASAQSNAATGFELQAVASCVIGGVFISGGSGTVPGVLLGSLLLSIIVNALAVTRVNPFWRMAIQGVIILVAVVIDTVMSRRAGKGEVQ